MTDNQPKISSAIMDLLIQIPIFDTLDPDELRIAVKYMNVVEAPPGEVVFREGERGDYVCFVADGTLDVIKTSETGHHVALSTLHKGRSIGEMSMLDNFPRSATVQARTKATLVTLTKQGFETIVDDHPRIGVKILKGVARLLSLALRKTSSRLADYMLPLS
ncbi:MAG: cyclic nucleotide-binding domain-containing protein [Thermodesulfobacteriota bacterium]